MNNINDCKKLQSHAFIALISCFVTHIAIAAIYSFRSQIRSRTLHKAVRKTPQLMKTFQSLTTSDQAMQGSFSILHSHIGLFISKFYKSFQRHSLHLTSACRKENKRQSSLHICGSVSLELTGLHTSFEVDTRINLAAYFRTRIHLHGVESFARPRQIHEDYLLQLQCVQILGLCINLLGGRPPRQVVDQRGGTVHDLELIDV